MFKIPDGYKMQVLIEEEWSDIHVLAILPSASQPSDKDDDMDRAVIVWIDANAQESDVFADGVDSVPFRMVKTGREPAGPVCAS